MLNLLIQHNDQVILTPDSLTRFHSKSAPDIKVLDYLNRIVKYTNMEVSLFPGLTEEGERVIFTNNTRNEMGGGNGKGNEGAWG